MPTLDTVVAHEIDAALLDDAMVPFVIAGVVNMSGYGQELERLSGA